MTSDDRARAPVERFGAIDIGTNTVLLLVVERRGSELRVERECATITRLGEGVDRTRRLSAEARARTLECLGRYRSALDEAGVQRFAVVGTSALRDAQGSADFLAEAERLLGRRPEVISGRVEAELTFEGALSGLPLVGPVTVFDVGGGSTEIISGSSGEAPSIDDAVSLDIGSVRLFERHVRLDPPADGELAELGRAIEAQLASAPPSRARATLVGVAGTVTTLAAIELGLEVYDPTRVHGHLLTRESAFAIRNQLAALDLSARQRLAGLEPKRADVIVVGAEIVCRVLTWSGADGLVVSDRGVRWGLVQRLAAGRPLFG